MKRNKNPLEDYSLGERFNAWIDKPLRGSRLVIQILISVVSAVIGSVGVSLLMVWLLK